MSTHTTKSDEAVAEFTGWRALLWPIHNHELKKFLPMGLMMFCILFIYTLYMIYIVIKTIYQPLEQNHIAKSAQDENYGSMMGLRQSFLSLGMFVGPLLGGLLYSVKPLLMFDFSALTFVMGVLMLIIMILIQKKKTIINDDL